MRTCSFGALAHVAIEQTYARPFFAVCDAMRAPCGILDTLLLGNEGSVGGTVPSSVHHRRWKGYLCTLLQDIEVYRESEKVFVAWRLSQKLDSPR